MHIFSDIASFWLTSIGKNPRDIEIPYDVSCFLMSHTSFDEAKLNLEFVSKPVFDAEQRSC